MTKSFRQAQGRPNIVLILNDDMGFSDIGCYGGEVQTPNLDALAANGLRYTQFYNTARCCPSCASLLTGLHPHQADVGDMVSDDEIDGYRGDLNPNTVTIAEALKASGYAAYMSGKWHVTRHIEPNGPKHSWPCQRGVDDFYGILTGAASYYQPRTLTRNNEAIDPEGDNYFFTDAISDEAARQIREHSGRKSDTPFFQYVAYTAPHWPLHAHADDIAKYKGRFDAGWDKLREERLDRMIDMGIIHENWRLRGRDPNVGPWEVQENKQWEARRMEVYAAQIDRMDQGIGRIVQALKESGQFENTVIVFLADNGGCAEDLGGGSESWVKKLVERHPYVGTLTTRDGRDVRFGNYPDIMPGSEDTYCSYGAPWANVSNTPFRFYKHWIHEGGLSTPFIAHWPVGIEAKGALRHQAAQLPDVMATFLDLAGVDYPETYEGKTIKPLEGFSMVPTFTDQPFSREVLCWEHHGNRGARKGKWKLVAQMHKDWELYDMEEDRSELNHLAAKNLKILEELKSLYFEDNKGTRVIMTTRDTDKRPNVIFFFTDTQRWDCSSLHGNPLDLMPNFDRYAMCGTHVFNAISPQPLCTPCRGCLMTGQYATESGIYTNGISIKEDQRTIAHCFNDAGYDTAYIGKWHLSSEKGDAETAGPVPKRLRGGYQYWLGANAIELVSDSYNCVVYDNDDKEVKLPGYRVDALTDAMIRYVDQDHDKPFFLFFSLLEPHTQNHLGSFVAPDGYRERYTGRWIPPDLAGLPGLTPDSPNEEQAHQGLGDYWGMVKHIDEALGRLMGALKSKGMEEDTIVVFTSDHGSHFNTRNKGGKCSPHESSVRVPTAIWGQKFNGGGRIEEVVSLLDLPPTLLDACGIDVPEQMVGHSILPLTRGDRDDWQNDVLIQTYGPELGRYVRTKRWKYGIASPDRDTWKKGMSEKYVEVVLYDLKNDPYEMKNLIGFESHAPVVAHLKGRLLARMAEAGETTPIIEDAPIRKSGQRRVDKEEIMQ